ncbi:MAG TPA: hypothetical protein VHG89_09505 [Verrucomicrobiae bacterium]|nr:hypothetical protein [Verrucomicrobiae bacterium]
MKMNVQNVCFALAMLVTLDLPSVTARAQAAAFTYQGRLNDGDGVANGSYDFAFTLYDAPTNGTVIGALTNNAVEVTNGLFTTTLDFGVAFTGSNYWLEIAVETNGDSTFATLAPRQPITSVPYALYAPNAANADFAASASVAANSPAGIFGSASTNNTADFDTAGAAQTAMDNYGQSVPANMTNSANYFAGSGLDINGNITITNGGLIIATPGLSSPTMKLQPDGGFITTGYISLQLDAASDVSQLFNGMFGMGCDVPVGQWWYDGEPALINLSRVGGGHGTNITWPNGAQNFIIGKHGQLIHWYDYDEMAAVDPFENATTNCSQVFVSRQDFSAYGQGPVWGNTNYFGWYSSPSTESIWFGLITNAVLEKTSPTRDASSTNTAISFVSGYPRQDILIKTNGNVVIPGLIDVPAEQLTGTLPPEVLPDHVTISSATSGTVAASSSNRSETIYLNSDSTIPSITIALPTSTIAGVQKFFVHSKSPVSSLSVTGGSFDDSPVNSLYAGQTIGYQAVDESGTYIRIR